MVIEPKEHQSGAVSIEGQNSEDDNLRCPGCGEYYENDEDKISEFYYYEAVCPGCKTKFLFTKVITTEFVYWLDSKYKTKESLNGNSNAS